MCEKNAIFHVTVVPIALPTLFVVTFLRSTHAGARFLDNAIVINHSAPTHMCRDSKRFSACGVNRGWLLSDPPAPALVAPGLCRMVWSVK